MKCLQKARHAVGEAGATPIAYSPPNQGLLTGAWSISFLATRLLSMKFIDVNAVWEARATLVAHSPLNQGLPSGWSNY